MTDQHQAIAALIEKIKAGQVSPASFRCLETPMQDMRYTQMPRDARHAYGGSLDAALSLHEALLPKWVVSHAWGNGDSWACNLNLRAVDGGPEYSCATSITLARAWLLAILRAYISHLSAASNRKGGAE